MKKTTYTMQVLSSLIVSPRSGQALYKDIDTFAVSPKLDEPDKKSDKEPEIKVVYPFYQYGEYEKYDPEHADYYLPGSSVKGALLHHAIPGNHIMADDIPVSNSDMVLRNLRKAQFLKDEKKAAFDLFFANVGVEMIKAETELSGNLYLEEDLKLSEIVEKASEDAKNKMNQMCQYLQKLLKRECKTIEFREIIQKVEENLCSLLNEKNVILLGGFKGLFHSILLDNMVLDRKIEESTGGVFIDMETLLPHGIVKINA